ncbi:hypothetical protein K435DRAFT_853640 [Dendrothele bispora CBS 962.96]|uniref:Uncharacterized protein n=1 Tax=Dendrothele bispora (strain CBS 962.96) TaxID=1314807 RepID=A0A4S8MH74_DENBC|nr:hypothetical protein K435DRAFT_853640 [Dendrothele bispora CBS 962.96]
MSIARSSSLIVRSSLIYRPTIDAHRLLIGTHRPLIAHTSPTHRPHIAHSSPAHRPLIARSSPDCFPEPTAIRSLLVQQRRESDAFGQTSIGTNAPPLKVYNSVPKPSDSETYEMSHKPSRTPAPGRGQQSFKPYSAPFSPYDPVRPRTLFNYRLSSRLPTTTSTRLTLSLMLSPLPLFPRQFSLSSSPRFGPTASENEGPSPVHIGSSPPLSSVQQDLYHPSHPQFPTVGATGTNVTTTQGADWGIHVRPTTRLTHTSKVAKHTS